MKMKICPCCDQPIEGIYCKGCRKIILKPVEQDVNYYLNTRHPDFEHACTYHDGEVRQSTSRMTPNEAAAKKDEIRARMIQRKQEDKSASKTVQKKTTTYTMAKPEVSTNPGLARKMLITVTTTVITIFMILFTFLMIGVINSGW